MNPLHGSAVTGFPADVAYRTPVLRDMHRAALSREFPLCQRCAKLAADARQKSHGGLSSGGVPGQQLRARVLRVEFDGKRQRYDEFRSVWREHSFGTDGPGLPQTVREHLDVS